MRPRHSRRRRNRGQALILFALASILLFGMGAIALDLSIGQADRRHLQEIADGASLAGSRTGTTMGAANNYIAMLYAKKNLGWSSLPTGCTSSTTCPAQTYTVGDYDVAVADTGGSIDVSITHRRNPVLGGILGFTTTSNATGAHEAAGAGARATVVGPATKPATYTLAALGGEALIDGGGTALPSGDVSGLVYAAADYGGNNGPHTVQMPTNVEGINSAGSAVACSPATPNEVDTAAGWSGKPYYSIGGTLTNNNTKSGVATPGTFPGLTPTVNGTAYATAAAGFDSTTSAYKPGTYSQVLPNNAALLPGVFAFKNLVGVDMTGWHNYGSPHPDTTLAGVQDTNGAVAIILDSTDSGTVTLSSVNLNGLDAVSSTGDLEGTHNFVLYGETFAGNVHLPQNQTSIISGIVDVPNSTLDGNGNVTFHFYGSVYAHDFLLSGGGNGAQTFTWVCGLQAYKANGGTGGETR
jgi:Flp pilus assembly protein TadG